PALVGRVRKYLDALTAREDSADRGRVLTIWLLIARDQPKELEQALRGWLGRDDTVRRWEVPLGYLLAEQGRAAQAVPLFEAVNADELGQAERRTLADWYQVLGQRERHEQALAAFHRALGEPLLRRTLALHLARWRRDAVPADLDPEVPRLFAALFEVSSVPAQHVWLLREFYLAR